jgi:periplasmic divalent cation tolerance protein
MSDAAAPRQTRLAVMTAPSAEAAEALVRALIEERLVACGNIVPGLTSIYRWRGAVECEAEVLVLLKTTAAALPRLLERAPALHPYEVPELLILPVETGHPPYLKWVAESVEPDIEKR